MPRVQQNVVHLRLPRPDEIRSENRRLYVPVDELLTPRFVARHTTYSDFGSLLHASRFRPDQIVSLEETSDRGWEDFIRGTSRFSSWRAMLKDARGEWIMRRLGFFNEA